MRQQKEDLKRTANGKSWSISLIGLSSNLNPTLTFLDTAKEKGSPEDTKDIQDLGPFCEEKGQISPKSHSDYLI